jgi:hypothetical protein
MNQGRKKAGRRHKGRREEGVVIEIEIGIEIGFCTAPRIARITRNNRQK